MPFEKGVSGNPTGRYPSTKSIQIRAKKHAEDALGVLIEIMQDNTATADSRVVAANSVLARADGKSGDHHD